MRIPLADLTDSYPNLGNRLSFIWRMLDAEDSALRFEHRMKLANEFELLISQIREKPGFSRFLLPREFSDLQRAAQIGPIVILNASQYRCDAFIILQSSLHVVPLDACDLKFLRVVQVVFRELALGIPIRQEHLARLASHRRSAQGPPIPPGDVPTGDVTGVGTGDGTGDDLPSDEMFRLTLDFLWSHVAYHA